MKKNLIAAIIILTFIFGCDNKQTYFAVQEESAVVTELSHIPSSVSYSTWLMPMQSGDTTLYFPMTDTKEEPEVWAVVFKCEKHNKEFALKSKELYEKLKVGQKVELEYVETIVYDPKKPNSDEIKDIHTTKIIFEIDGKTIIIERE